MTKQYEPIFRKCKAHQDRNLLYFVSLLNGHAVEAGDFQLKGCGLHLTQKIPLDFLIASHQTYFIVLIFYFILFILFIVQCIILMSGFSARKTGLHNAMSVTGVLCDPFYVHTAILISHCHVSFHTETS